MLNSDRIKAGAAAVTADQNFVDGVTGQSGCYELVNVLNHLRHWANGNGGSKNFDAAIKQSAALFALDVEEEEVEEPDVEIRVFEGKLGSYRKYFELDEYEDEDIAECLTWHIDAASEDTLRDGVIRTVGVEIRRAK